MKKKIYKKWWFWLIVIILIPIIKLFCEGFQEGYSQTNSIQNTVQTEKTYILTGTVAGEYGKKIILNKNTDMPTEKYIYKIPKGNYTATTNNDNITSFFIVKDDIKTNKGEKYPEELEYVENKSYLITKNESKTNDTIKKEVEFTIEKDESILIIESDTIIIKSR